MCHRYTPAPAAPIHTLCRRLTCLYRDCCGGDCCGGCPYYDCCRQHGNLPATAQSYSVTYHANGGNGHYQDSGLQHGATYTVKAASAAGIEHGERRLECWNRAPAGGKTCHPPGSVITVLGDIELYAQWQE